MWNKAVELVSSLQRSLVFPIMAFTSAVIQILGLWAQYHLKLCR